MSAPSAAPSAPSTATAATPAPVTPAPVTPAPVTLPSGWPYSTSPHMSTDSCGGRAMKNIYAAMIIFLYS